jgi:hypothetical protein
MGAAPTAVLVVSPVGKVDRRLGAEALYPLHVGNNGQHAREGYEYRSTRSLQPLLLAVRH